MTASAFIDWTTAVRTGARLASPGPRMHPQQARQVVADLYHHAQTASGLVAQATQLPADTSSVQVVVLDRPGWIHANAAAFQLLLEPLVDALASKQNHPKQNSAHKESQHAGGKPSLDARLSGMQLGAALAFLSTKVLGQYELVPAGAVSLEQADARQGRLLLVAPNVVAVERKLQVDPDDFRLWVCIHEQTHRLQFSAVPWLREHIVGLLHEAIRASDDDDENMTVTQRLQRLAGVVRHGNILGEEDTSGGSNGDAAHAGRASALSSPAQRQVVGRITAVMSLLEGHADYVMDSVGPTVIPTVETIRRKFTARRMNAPRPERMLRRLFGMDAKLRQYQQGARFVSTVVDAAGMAGFNRVWTSPNTLPTAQEISQPQVWLRRMGASGQPGVSHS